jgi:hypothetical protein
MIAWPPVVGLSNCTSSLKQYARMCCGCKCSLDKLLSVIQLSPLGAPTAV